AKTSARGPRPVDGVGGQASDRRSDRPDGPGKRLWTVPARWTAAGIGSLRTSGGSPPRLGLRTQPTPPTALLAPEV
ncbi:MAG: hypothetical protein AAB433_17810, partial [Nitrospirota bacterium]